MSCPTGIYIGRFQPFHNGHKSVVEKMISENAQNILILGTLDIDTGKNPFSPEWRKDVITELYPNVGIQTLADNPDNTQWIQSLISLLENYESNNYRFYCGDRENDYAIQVIEQHKDMFEGKEIEIVEIPRTLLPISATQVRGKIAKQGKESVEGDVPKEVYEKIKI